MKAKDCLGSFRSQHKSVKNCSCKKLKQASLHHPHQQVVDAILGRRENKPAILLIQISRCLQIEKKMLFQAQESEIHQYTYQIEKKLRYHVAVPTSKHKRGKFTNTGTIGLLTCHASLATTSPKRWNSAYKSNQLFQFCS